MATCLSCMGEGQHDFRDCDARLSEEFSDEDLAAMRRRGFQHPLGVIECDLCGGTGEIDEEEYRDIMAVSVAVLDQYKAEWSEKFSNFLGQA